MKYRKEAQSGNIILVSENEEERDFLDMIQPDEVIMLNGRMSDHEKVEATFRVKRISKFRSVIVE